MPPSSAVSWACRVVGTAQATAVLRDGQVVTVSCAEGEEGMVYEEVPYTHEALDVGVSPDRHTKVMLNVGNPEQAFSLSFLPNDGVGLAREEFVISSAIQVHPMALIRFDTLPRADQRADRATHPALPTSPLLRGAAGRGVGQLAAAFYPKDVIVRLSDFKTNEYAGLLGGEGFEPKKTPCSGFAAPPAIMTRATGRDFSWSVRP